MSTSNLLILDARLIPAIEACASEYGFSSETKLTQDWQMHFSGHASHHPALLANPSVLMGNRFQSVLVINGPNLNLLGTREPGIYGTDTLADITARCQALADNASCKLEFRQTNHEGEIVTWIQEATDVDALVINAAAYTHTSIAIHDALKNYSGRVVELHISNPHQRERFRHHSFITSSADTACIGLGAVGYELITELICTEADAP